LRRCSPFQAPDGTSYGPIREEATAECALPQDRVAPESRAYRYRVGSGGPTGGGSLGGCISAPVAGPRPVGGTKVRRLARRSSNDQLLGRPPCADENARRSRRLVSNAGNAVASSKKTAPLAARPSPRPLFTQVHPRHPQRPARPVPVFRRSRTPIYVSLSGVKNDH